MIRDPERIAIVLAEVERLWRERPDMRLGQLIWAISLQDPFHLEDHELVQRIRRSFEDD